MLANCKLTFQVTSSGCINRDVTCVQTAATPRHLRGADRPRCSRAQTCAATSAAAIAVPGDQPVGTCFQQCVTDAVTAASRRRFAAGARTRGCVEPFAAAPAAAGEAS